MTNKVDPTLEKARLRQEIERWVLRARVDQDRYSANDATTAILALFTKHSEQVEREAREQAIVVGLIQELAQIGTLEIVEHIPEYPGYNVGVEFDDDSSISVPGDTLLEALQNLRKDWRVNATLGHIKSLKANLQQSNKELEEE